MSSIIEPKVPLKDEKIARALIDSTAKRKAEDEIEIDIAQPVPLSKKQKRLLRRGKITINELDSKYNIDPKSIESYTKELESKQVAETKENFTIDAPESFDNSKNYDNSAALKKEKARKFGVWIGNLSFDTSKDDIIRFIVNKTKVLDENYRVSESCILRINMPLSNTNGKQTKNKGFAYVDFRTKEQMQAVIGLTETQLNSRNLLIKNSNNFEGRPGKNDFVNPKSRILFVGNLSFDTTEDLLKKHFQHCGEIVRIRMATFEDSGKCKGFAFIDFKDDSGSTIALKDPACKKIASRSLRMEYGEDRSARHIRAKPNLAASHSTKPDSAEACEHINHASKKTSTYKKRQPGHKNLSNCLESNEASSNLQRASAAIVPSTGKKIKFD